MLIEMLYFKTISRNSRFFSIRRNNLSFRTLQYMKFTIPWSICNIYDLRTSWPYIDGQRDLMAKKVNY